MNQRLSALDAGFLEAEDADQHASLAIGAVAVIEGPPPASAAFLSTIAQRTQSIPRWTQVLKCQPWDLTAPEWVDDDRFDIHRHARRVAVTAPGDDAALFRLVAELMERRLDRARPLWECWLIDGLSGDRWALLLKIHHSMADGMAAGAMLAALCDGNATNTEFPDGADDGRDVDRRHLDRGALNWLSGVWNTSFDTVRTVRRAALGATEIAAGILSTAAQEFTGPLTDLRRFSAATVSLADVKSICHRFDVTINDVALAAITDSFREAMLRRDRPIRRDSLRTLVPVSVRAPEDVHTPDNRVSVMLPLLPVEQTDPLQRLRCVHRRLTTSKLSGQSQAGSAAILATNLIPFPLTAWLIRLLAKLPQRGVVTVATNVPGPRHQVMVMGRPVLSLLPIPPIAIHLRLGIAITSYGDQLTFGVIGDFDGSVGADEIARGIEDGIDHLVTITRACKESRRVRGRLLLLSS
ncbi:WS/DGAT/MGAT family O-acyltransferase [Mycolicibacterium komossense]|uniref:Diacylglycerol O-acyltransferase n=1 Tax=Mycolicibacterium komossense TaxID=1779 RepID=A0ABT3CJ84_9MYCO|nr:wax ester/triacylglycerol synthase family O-acyltransferase [Mycolicibacterium komossense]MCV7229596.1 wax ester/triacylglycerol synthase family O-acyltransferase [Mycolicibacterium komossense]